MMLVDDWSHVVREAARELQRMAVEPNPIRLSLLQAVLASAQHVTQQRDEDLSLGGHPASLPRSDLRGELEALRLNAVRDEERRLPPGWRPA